MLARKKYRLKKNFSLKKKLSEKNFKSKKFWSEKKIAVRKKFNLFRKKNLVWKKYFGPKIILVKKNLVHNFFDLKFSDFKEKLFWIKNLLDWNLFEAKFCFDKIFWSQNNLSKKIWLKKIFDLKFLDLKKFETKLFFWTKNYFWI